MFEDVVEDFHSLDYIKSHFEVWRRDYSECYREAFIGLCLPKLFNPLVRLQLMTWNPLEVRPEATQVFHCSGPTELSPPSSVQVECDNFEYMLWFESLLFYGFDEQTAVQKGDGDNGLLPSIVEKVVLSKLTGGKIASTLKEESCLKMVKGTGCVCASAGGAGVGPAVQEPDRPPGGIPSPAEERLPHRAARRQQIHTGRVADRPSVCSASIPGGDASLSPSGASENDCAEDQTDSG